MAFRLEEINADEDFPELIQCEWEAYENPEQYFFRLFCPIVGSHPNARQESLEECTARQREWHLSDPTSYWQKVVDTGTGKIVAGALWKICSRNPFEEQEHESAYWYPEGDRREYVNAALELFEAPRSRLAPVPQWKDCLLVVKDLNIIFTLPEYRRKGIGDMIMEWGVAKAAQMHVDMWLDATIYGIPLYKKHGFMIVNENNLCPQRESPSKEWEAIHRELSPMVMWQMKKSV
ncbi:MAG: hypothetical protein Q9165_008838 [Trypethelium subeluteriae]